LSPVTESRATIENVANALLGSKRRAAAKKARMVGMRFLRGGAEPVLLEFPQKAKTIVAKAPRYGLWLGSTTTPSGL